MPSVVLRDIAALSLILVETVIAHRGPAIRILPRPPLVPVLLGPVLLGLAPCHAQTSSR
jgi:hypothetical protein